MHTNSTLYTRIGPQWLSELKQSVAKCSLTTCMTALFPDRFPHYAWTAQSAHLDFAGARVYACLSVTGHLHFWHNDQGLLRATAVTRRVERTPNESQRRRLTLEKKFLPVQVPGIKSVALKS